MSDSEDDPYGPALPPGFSDSKRKHSSSSSEDDSYGPALPSNLQQSKCDKAQTQSGNTTAKSDNVIGPVLPSHLQKPKTAAYSSDSDSDSSSNSESESRSYKKQKVDTADKPQTIKSGRVMGPSLPPSGVTNMSGSVSGPFNSVENPSDDDDDGFVIGPSLHMQASERDQASAVDDFEQRAQRMKDKLEGKIHEDEEPKGRETWMTELPSNMGVKFGLENRQFRKNAAPEQDSSWTETPQDKERREQEGKAPKKQAMYIPNEKDLAMTKDIEEYNKKNRPKSLLEMHQKKQKKEKKKEKKKKEKKKSKKKGKDKDKDDPNERRPFDREVDLQVNKLDEAQKRAIIKRSQELGSRFKSGGMGTSFL